MKDFLSLMFGIICLLVGIIALFFPYKIQKYTLNFYDNHPKHAMLNPFTDWMKTGRYIISLRLSGVIAILMFLLIAFGFIFGK